MFLAYRHQNQNVPKRFAAPELQANQEILKKDPLNIGPALESMLRGLKVLQHGLLLAHHQTRNGFDIVSSCEKSERNVFELHTSHTY